jgi:hypothetical protein
VPLFGVSPSEDEKAPKGDVCSLTPNKRVRNLLPTQNVSPASKNTKPFHHQSFRNKKKANRPFDSIHLSLLNPSTSPHNKHKKSTKETKNGLHFFLLVLFVVLHAPTFNGGYRDPRVIDSSHETHRTIIPARGSLLSFPTRNVLAQHQQHQ